MSGKRGGAFAHPTVLSAHPFVFTNYTGNYSSVTTVAHELGHVFAGHFAQPIAIAAGGEAPRCELEQEMEADAIARLAAEAPAIER